MGATFNAVLFKGCTGSQDGGGRLTCIRRGTVQGHFLCIQLVLIISIIKGLEYLAFGISEANLLTEVELQ